MTTSYTFPSEDIYSSLASGISKLHGRIRPGGGSVAWMQTRYLILAAAVTALVILVAAAWWLVTLF